MSPSTPILAEVKHGGSVLDEFLLENYQWPNFSGYEALSQISKEIRLLRIWLTEDTALHGQILHASLNDPPDYEAISYYWGPPSEQNSIQISGESLSIRASLHSFLCILCLGKENCLVWVDSLCINQRDLDERNWQVAAMGDIYRCATRTNIWLGNADADTEYVFAYLQSYSLLRDAIFLRGDHIRRRARDSAEYLGARPYWGRMWIIQEVGLSNEVQVFCGSRSVPWKGLLDGLSALHSKHSTSPTSITEMRSGHATSPLAFVAKLEELRHSIAVSQKGQGQTILERVAQFGHQKCEDERDKVFAMMNLVERGERVQIDYRKTIAEIFLDILWSKLSKTPTLDSAYSPKEFSEVLRSVGESILRFDTSNMLMPLGESDELHDWCHYLRSKSYQRSSEIKYLQTRLINVFSSNNSAHHVNTLYGAPKQPGPRTLTGVVFHLPKLMYTDNSPEWYDHKGVKLVVGQSEADTDTLQIQGVCVNESLTYGQNLLIDGVLAREIQLCRSIAAVDDFCVVKVHYTRWMVLILTYVLAEKITPDTIGDFRAYHTELRRKRPVPWLCQCKVDLSQNRKGLKLFRAAFNRIEFR